MRHLLEYFIKYHRVTFESFINSLDRNLFILDAIPIGCSQHSQITYYLRLLSKSLCTYVRASMFWFNWLVTCNRQRGSKFDKRFQCTLRRYQNTCTLYIVTLKWISMCAARAMTGLAVFTHRHCTYQILWMQGERVSKLFTLVCRTNDWTSEVKGRFL